MRTLALTTLIWLSTAVLGCSASNGPVGTANAAAGSGQEQAAGSGASAAGSSASGSGSGAGSGGSSANGGAAAAGAGPTAGSAGGVGSAGSTGSAGAGTGTGTAGNKSTGDGTLGNGDYSGSGTSDARYYTAADIKRNGQNYVLITNGWGPGFQSHTISWNGTAFTVDKMEGKAGSGGQPASYPTVFCGQYSVMQRGDCGLPKAVSEMTSLKTGWRWASNGNDNGKYNAAYDIWVGDATTFTGYLMVWLRDPPGFQPAGSPNPMHQGVTVANVEGTWDVWNGSVNNRPIVNWVRHEGTDSHEIEFDVLDFVRDAEKRGLTIPGSTHVRAVAVGFEIWEGPIAGLQSLDFYAQVK
jgi:glycosyl hydrolase family 12